MKKEIEGDFLVEGCRGRPTLPADKKRVHKVTLALTATEYNYFKTLAGHEANDKKVFRSAKPTARPKREHGSIAGFVRLMMQTNRPLMSVEQERILTQIADMSNNLARLTKMAKDIEYDVVARQLEKLYGQLMDLLDEYTQQKRNKHLDKNHGR
ncbi:hypothetical protein [Fibrella aquatica]|uniref:hypothetical protein n=1 Tax=Fibrella aquatica TaxID=3242487 RepID=UPI0035214330